MRTIIAAVSEDGFIGKDDKIPWRVKSDLEHFSATTTGHIVIMGRKTWDSIPLRFRPLPNRQNIVVTRQTGFTASGSHVVNSLADAFSFAEPYEYNEDRNVFIMGGEQIYQLALPYTERIVLTRIHKTINNGDARFPNLDPNEWNRTCQENLVRGEKDECDSTIECYSPNIPFIELAGIRTGNQLQTMRIIRLANHCPFCPENLLLYHKKPILWEGKHWILTENQWPYPGKNIHLLLVSKRHIENAGSITVEEWEEFHNTVTKIENEYGFIGGAICMRSGNPVLSGASVKHIHAQIISPKQGETTKFYIGTSRERVA